MPERKIKAGCCSNVIEVPLFTELYGYGPFLGRRNRGTLDPLFCRCASFFDGKNRVVIISNDLVTMDPERTREIRCEVSGKSDVSSRNIMICGSHTHSGPTISKGIGWGELDPKFVASWVKTVVKTAVAAVKNETSVTMRCGKALLSEKIGYNRVWKEGPTDPEIRWAGFYTASNDLKLLMHNHAMHGVVFGPGMLYVSADWPGAVNQTIINRKITGNVLFLQGTAGDINSKEPCCLPMEEGKKALAGITEVYIRSLEAGLDGGLQMSPVPVKTASKKMELPSEDVTPEYLRENAPKVRKISEVSAYQADRMEEMAVYMEAGGSVKIDTDLQVLRIGDLFIYAVGGEPFYEIGREILDKSPGKAAMVVSNANDNCRYIPTPKTFFENPDIIPGKSGVNYGYYETQFSGFGRYRAKYRADVGPVLIENYLKLAKSISDD